MRSIAELLAALPAHFGSVAPSLAAASPGYELAQELADAARQASLCGSHGLPDETVERLVLAATEALAGFSSAAAAALASSGAASPAQPAPPMGLTAQMLAATSSLTSCISLVGINPSLPAQTAVRIGAACSLVFGPGCSLLGWLLKAAEAAPSTAVRSQIDSLCASQLESVASTALVLGCNSTPQAAAAFAAGTAKPAALLPWLATVMCAIPADDPGCGSPEGDLPSTSREFALMMQEMLTEQRWAKHRAAILSTPSLQRSVARVVLNHCLPHVAGYVAAGIQKGAPLLPSSSTLLAVSAVLASGVAGSPGSSQLGAAGAAAAVHHAARALKALPTQRNGEPAHTLLEAHLSAASLLAFLSQRISLGVTAAVRSARSSGDSSSNAAGRQAAAGAYLQEAGPAGWALVGAMPHLEATLRSLAADIEDPSQFSPWDPDRALLNLSRHCELVGYALMLPSGRQHQQASAAQLAAWAAAMAAAARLLPLLARLSGRLRQLGHEPEGIALLADVALSFLATGLPEAPWLEPGSTAAAEPHDSPARRNAAEAFLQLHCTMARLLNWLAVEGNSCGLWQPEILAEQWLPLLSSFGRVWCAAHMVRCRRILPPNHWPQLGEVPEEGMPLLQVAACEHRAAVEAVLAVAGPLKWGCSDSQVLVQSWLLSGWLVGGLAGADFVTPLETALRTARPESPHDWERHGSSLCLLQCLAAKHGPVAASLMRSGLSGMALDAASRLSKSVDGSNARTLAVSLVCGWLASVNALVQCAWAYTQKDAWRGVQDSLAEQLQAAAARVQRTLSELALPATADGAVAADSLANMRRLCLQPAAELAALVQQYLEHPLYEADRRRSVMRVVARRCCAYLGCTNVEAGGGPAARQGAGSRRCSACRAVWYCGTACSHADWRAGHKRVCKALAAERQAAKAAKAAEAAAARIDQLAAAATPPN